MPRLAVAANEDVAALVWAGSGFPRTQEVGGAPAVSFGASADVDIAWLRHPGEKRNGTRTIATAGEGLWRRAPWPAADDLFEWTSEGERALVVGGRAARPVVERLRDAGANVHVVDVLGPAELRAAAVVVLAGATDDPFPAEVPALLAAGRIVVMPPATPDFGFRAGIDHCVGSSAGDLADLALAALRHPRAFESMRVYGRIAAERHRASRVFAGLATDLELGL